MFFLFPHNYRAVLYRSLAQNTSLFVQSAEAFYEWETIFHWVFCVFCMSSERHQLNFL